MKISEHNVRKAAALLGLELPTYVGEGATYGAETIDGKQSRWISSVNDPLIGLAVALLRKLAIERDGYAASSVYGQAVSILMLRKNWKLKRVRPTDARRNREFFDSLPGFDHGPCVFGTIDDPTILWEPYDITREDVQRLEKWAEANGYTYAFDARISPHMPGHTTAIVAWKKDRDETRSFHLPLATTR